MLYRITMNKERAIILKIVNDIIGPVKSPGRENRIEEICNILKISKRSFANKSSPTNTKTSFSGSEIVALSKMNGDTSFANYLNMEVGILGIRLNAMHEVSDSELPLTSSTISRYVKNSVSHNSSLVEHSIGALADKQINIKDINHILNSINHAVDNLLLYRFAVEQHKSKTGK